MHDGGSVADAGHHQLPALTVTVAGHHYTVHPDDGAVTIGRELPADSRELPAHIRVDDPHISRTHIRIEPAGDSWWLTDPGSRNGTFIDGNQVDSVPINRSLTVHLGNANGVAIQLGTLADRIEDGPRTAATPLGQVDDAETTAEDESTEALGTTVRVTVMVDAAEIGLQSLRRRIAAIPAPHDPQFRPTTNNLLADLRRLENAITHDARGAPGRPEAAVILSDVRNTYADLMLRAAREPGSTLGQRVYAARNAARLTMQEIATAAAIQIDDVTNVEAERPVAEATEAALQAVVDALTHHRLSR